MHYLILRGFFSDAECDELIRLGLASGRMARSSGFDSATGEQTVSTYRTSEHLFFGIGENPLIATLEDRIADATGIPVNHSEGFQLAHYPAGTYYDKHHDYFHTEYAASEKATVRGGQRVITFMIYLNTLPEGAGGETHFPHMDIKIRPEKGKACIWWNVYPDWRVDASTEHAALKPEPGFEKWICTKWLRANAFY